jgi:hypothetical protein
VVELRKETKNNDAGEIKTIIRKQVRVLILIIKLINVKMQCNNLPAGAPTVTKTQE